MTDKAKFIPASATFLSSKKDTSAKFLHLDMLRGLAALSVLIGHVRDQCLVESSTLDGSHKVQYFLLKVAYFFTGFQSHAVMVFFVLSGFLVGSSVLRTCQRQQWSWETYLTQRLTRLYVVLIPALFLTLGWDRLGIALFSGRGFYEGKLDWLTFHGPIVDRLAIPHFFGNLLFLQTIVAKPFGSDGPLWSLAFEFWYYILFPLGILALSRKTPLPLKMFYGLLTIVIFQAVGYKIALHYFVWLMGALIAILPPLPLLRSEQSAKRFAVAALIFFLTLITGARFYTILSPGKDFLKVFLIDCVIGLATTVLVYAIVNIRSIPKPSLYTKTATTLSGFSYTLYLVHMPPLLFLQAWLTSQGRWQPDLPHLALLMLICAGLLGFSYGIAQLTEAHTNSVRNIIAARLLMRPAIR